MSGRSYIYDAVTVAVYAVMSYDTRYIPWIHNEYNNTRVTDINTHMTRMELKRGVWFQMKRNNSHNLQTYFYTMGTMYYFYSIAICYFS